MPDNRRGFLKKLGIGSVVMSAAGIFTLKKDIILPKNFEKEHMEAAKDDEILEIANSILNVVDGKSGGKYDGMVRVALNTNIKHLVPNAPYRF